MNHWLGIVGSKLTYERFSQSTDYWFCMPKSCEIGDQIVMYSSKKAAGFNSGIFGYFWVIDKDGLKDVHCNQYGYLSGTGEKLVHVELKKIKLLNNSVPFNKIKSISILSNTTYVRRNMQATYFSLQKKEYRAMWQLGEFLEP
jgi:hypothetical protein